MKSFVPKRKDNLEHRIQEEVEDMLRIKQWFVQRMHGNLYQFGVPDIFTCHHRYGHRWIEVKLPNMEGSVFTAAQLEVFPKLCGSGSGVWILTAATDKEYDKLFHPYNWWQMLPHYKK